MAQNEVGLSPETDSGVPICACGRECFLSTPRACHLGGAPGDDRQVWLCPDMGHAAYVVEGATDG